MVHHVHLHDLGTFAPVLTESAVPFYVECCLVSLDDQQHQSGVNMSVEFKGVERSLIVSWLTQVTDDMRRCHADNKKRVDFGACAVAFIILAELAGLEAFEQSATGDGVDYYLRSRNAHDDLIFNEAARLEISGIQRANAKNSIKRRVADKVLRLDNYARLSTSPTPELPTYICVVDFGAPQSAVRQW